ncbi:MAG: Rieske 2Fe-2S domain-containing protein [Alicyclobacillus sp.]|nr:Rieske 2Fe-2S domain-containing protein [Alicyclobacillus sp.]
MSMAESAVSFSSTENRTLPYRLYTDPVVLQEEYRHIFKRSWQYVGHESQVANPGDYFTVEVAAEPIFVVRGTDGIVRAFFNVCPHRGTQLVADGSGCKKVFQCCYHGWTFKPEGQLHHAPNMRNIPGFCEGEYGLKPIPLEIHQGLMFVHLGADVIPFAVEYKDFLDDLSQFTHLPELRLHTVRQRVIRCNWKAFIDNFLECDHCPIAHPSFVATLDMSKYQILNGGKCNIQGSTMKASRREYENAEIQGGRFYWLWPNVMFTIYPGPGNLRVIHIAPVDHGRCLATYSVFLREGGPTTEQEALIAFTEQVAEEDIVLVELQQKGFECSAFPDGVYSPTEHGVRHFHTLVREALSNR